MLKIKVEKIMEFDGKDGEKLQIPAGSYEQTIIRNDGTEIEILRQIVAAVNQI